MRDKPEYVLGSDLRIGDTIEVWWQPRRDTIVSLSPYRGPLASIFPSGAQIAAFAIGPSMTIDNGGLYERHKFKAAL